MTRLLLFITIVPIVSLWLQPLTSTILNMKGTFVQFLSLNLPIGWLGFTAIFIALGFSIFYGFLQFFK